MSKKEYRSVKNAAGIVFFYAIVACNQPGATEAISEQSSNEITTEVAQEEEPQKTIVSEHHVNDVAVTSRVNEESEGNISSESEANTDASEDDGIEVRERTTLDRQAELDEKYEVTTHEELKTSLTEADYIAMNEITLTQTVIPLGDSHSIVSYSNNGKAKDTLHVVINGEGEIEHIIFTHKHHKDEYEVENGMTAKEVKELRKDVKHMVKHGKVFLYADNSNIMYVLEAKNAMGDEAVAVDVDELAYEGEIDEMTVQAIVWKDKRTLDDMGIEE